MFFKEKINEIERKIISAISAIKDLDKAIESLKESSKEQKDAIDKFIKSISEKQNERHPNKITKITIDEDTIEINQPSIAELVEWGKKYNLENSEKEYFSGLGYLVSTPYNCATFLEDAGIDFETISSYEFFCMLVNSQPEFFKRFFEITLKINNKVMFKFELHKRNSDDAIVIYDNENTIGITEEIYDELFEFVVKTYGYKDTREKTFTNKDTQKLFIAHQRLKSEKNKDKEYFQFIPTLVSEKVKSIKQIENLNELMDIPLGEFFKHHQRSNSDS